MCKSSIWLVNVHSLALEDYHFLAFEKLLLAKDVCGHRVPPGLPVLGLRALGYSQTEEEKMKLVTTMAGDI